MPVRRVVHLIRDDAISLREAGLTYDQIGVKLGVSINTAYRAVNREKTAAYARARRRRAREGACGPCAICGADVSRPGVMCCAVCRRAERLDRRCQIVSRYLDGARIATIAEEFDSTPAGVARLLGRLREQGCPLPGGRSGARRAAARDAVEVWFE